MSTLGQKPATQHVSTEKQTITGNGGTSYTLQQSVSQASDIEVFVNNTRQEPTVAYTASGTTLTMTGAVNASDSFYVIFQGKAIQTAGLPVDAAITASTITTSQTITSTGNITTSGTVNTPSINGGQIGGRRNMIINGAMNVAQRGTSTSSVGASSGYFACDRWRLFSNTSGRATVSQSTDAPNGFKNSFKIDVTTADTSIAATELFILSYAMEGQDAQMIKKGTSEAESLTMSFYAKANASANYVVEMYDADNTRNNTQAFTVTDSWQRFSFTFAPDTTGALDDDNALSFYPIQIWLHGGSDYSSGTFASNTWGSVTNANRYAGSRTSIFDSTDREFYVTGVQVEVGSQATPFEYKTFGEELSLCQRYFQRLATISTYGPIGIGRAWSTSRMNVSYPLKVTMRDNPSLSVSDFGHMQVAGISQNLDAIHNDGNSGTTVATDKECTGIKIGFGHASAAFTTGTIYQAEFDNVAEGYIDIDSEL